MKRFVKIRTLCTNLFSTILLVTITASCSMMTEDRSDCPEGLYVNFVYDYNIQRADMFKDHVGYVTVYVFDEADRLVIQRNAGNYGQDRPLAEYGYQMHFTPAELPAGNYKLIAVAMQKDWDNALATPGAKYRRTSLTAGSNKSQLRVTLDRGEKNADNLCPVDNSVALDTLWVGTTLNSPITTVKAQAPTYATISLVRDTKTLNVTLRDIDHPDEVKAEDYELTIVEDNGIVDADNTVLSDDSLLYRPYAEWTTEFPETRATQEKTAHYDINFNRLMYTTDQNEMAVMTLKNKKTGETIGEFNLAHILSEARNAFEMQHYGRQEYLDREYDYRLDFVLKGDKWQYISIKVGILAWDMRIQNTEL